MLDRGDGGELSDVFLPKLTCWEIGAGTLRRTHAYPYFVRRRIHIRLLANLAGCRVWREGQGQQRQYDAREQDLLQQFSWKGFEAVRELRDRNALLRKMEAAHGAPRAHVVFIV